MTVIAPITTPAADPAVHWSADARPVPSRAPAPAPLRVVPSWWRTISAAALWLLLAGVTALWLRGGGLNEVGSVAGFLTSFGRLTGLIASALLLVQVLLT